MVDIQSATAENRRGKIRRKKKAVKHNGLPLLRKGDHNYHVQDIHDLSVTTITNIKITDYVNIKPTVIHFMAFVTWTAQQPDDLHFNHTRKPSVEAALLESPQSRKPPIEAALVVTYLQFPIHVCFPCSASPSPTLLASPTTVWYRCVNLHHLADITRALKYWATLEAT